MDPPPSFDWDFKDEWSLWVLDNGLPELPATVSLGQSVPIARWSDARLGAVLQVSRDEDEGDDYLDTNVQVFWRTPDGWETSDAEGGSNWLGHNLEAPGLPPRGVHFAHVHCSGNLCAGDGVAGADASVVELLDEDGVTRRPIESPLRAFIVVFDSRTVATVRVLDESGNAMAEHRYPSPPWSASK